NGGASEQTFRIPTKFGMQITRFAGAHHTSTSFVGIGIGCGVTSGTYPFFAPPDAPTGPVFQLRLNQGGLVYELLYARGDGVTPITKETLSTAVPAVSKGAYLVLDWNPIDKVLRAIIDGVVAKEVTDADLLPHYTPELVINGHCGCNYYVTTG